jgi:hypothetical protein
MKHHIISIWGVPVDAIAYFFKYIKNCTEEDHRYHHYRGLSIMLIPYGIYCTVGCGATIGTKKFPKPWMSAVVYPFPIFNVAVSLKDCVVPNGLENHRWPGACTLTVPAPTATCALTTSPSSSPAPAASLSPTAAQPAGSRYTNTTKRRHSFHSYMSAEDVASVNMWNYLANCSRIGAIIADV